MADYPISNVPRRIVYTGSAGVGPYAFPFEVLLNTDINVYKNDVLLTLTTNYTVTISPTLGTGTVTLVVAATGADRITIVGSRAVQRTTDFTTGGDFFANTINNELDSQTILTQQVAETAERSIKAPVTDPTNINMTLPINTSRAGKTLAFDVNGNPVPGEPIGNFRGNWAAGTAYQNRDTVKDTTTSNVFVVLVSHTSSGALPITTNVDSAKFALLVDAAAAGASASAAAASASSAASSASSATSSASSATSSASSATTSASNAANAQTAAESARDQTLASFDSFDDRYLGAKTSNPTLDNDGNALLAGALYFNSVSGEMRVYTGTAWVAAYVSGTGFLVATSNLSDVGNVATSRTNLGLGTLATLNTIANANITANTIGLDKLARVGTAGQVLTSAGTGGDPSYQALPISGFGNIQVFETSGTFTVPANITKVKVTVVGGGGNGGSSAAISSFFSGGGGGGGGFTIEIVSGLTPAGTVAVTVGGAAGTSSFGAFCSATGGANGINGTAGDVGAGGIGGAGSGGNLNINGGSGNAGISNGSGGGQGGSSIIGFGASMAAFNSIGRAGNNYGGGGSGGTGNTAGAKAGGAGASGVVIVEF